jgi:hypothetical protein
MDHCSALGGLFTSKALNQDEIVLPEITSDWNSSSSNKVDLT